jgi:hypothetical protein
LTAASGSPTNTVLGNAPGETSTSTSTGNASIPNSENVCSLASMAGKCGVRNSELDPKARVPRVLASPRILCREAGACASFCHFRHSITDDLKVVPCYDLGRLAKLFRHELARKTTMAKRKTSETAPTSVATQSIEIGLLIAASHFVREAGGWREAEAQLKAVQDLVNTCGGFDRAQEMVSSLEVIRGNLDGLAVPEPHATETVE